MARKHNVEEVLKSLSKKKDFRINGNHIEVLKDKVFSQKTHQLEVNPKKHFDLGNGSWGKIDYLKKELNLTVVFVSDFI